MEPEPLQRAPLWELRIPLEESRELDHLTSAEREIAVALTRGWTSASVAKHRGVSPATVANQIASLFDKLDVHCRSELASRLAGVVLGPILGTTPTRRRPLRDDAPRVLVIEDSPRTREEISRALLDVGYGVVAASELAAGRHLIDSASPDVVLCDVRLGDESGIDLLATRSTPPPCPVLLMSGAAELDEALRGLAHGAWDFVDKAWGVERIRIALGEALGGAAPRRLAPMTSADVESIDAARAAALLGSGRARFVVAFEHDRARRVLLEPGSGLALSAREHFAIARLLELAPTKAIAAELGVSEVTAWTVLHHAIEKLGFAHRTEAVSCLAPLAQWWSSTASP